MAVVIEDRGRNNRIELPVDVLAKCTGKITVLGDENEIVVGEGTFLRQVTISTDKGGGHFFAGANCLLAGIFRCNARGAAISIGTGTTIQQARILCMEAGNIRIGDDCMFSEQIYMTNSDMHSVIDAATGKRINPPADITIEPHVWIGLGATILKGTHIKRDAVVAAHSVVRGHVPGGTIVAGIPAKVIRTGVTWDRRLLPID